MTEPRTARDWALAYAELGWRVFPVVPGGTKPLRVGWQRAATTDPGEIERSWRRAPAANIGIVCGEAFDAFDIEAAHLRGLRAWLEAHGHGLPLTPLARTGRGGIHLLVRPTGGGGGRDLYLDGVHVGELKSRGGFIVVAPSITEERYRWLRPPGETPLAQAPGWLLELLRRPALGRSAPSGNGPAYGARRRDLDALARAIAGVGVGRRNKYLYWAMLRAEEEGVPAPEAARTLGRSALDAGLEEREVLATIRSAHRRARQ